jgi:hypothetical protein
MEFKSQICTSVEQSKRLLKLGLKKETADMVHYFSHSLAECWTIVPLDNGEVAKNNDLEIPAWSLHRLLLLLNCAYVELDANNPFEDCITRIEFLIKESKIFNQDYLEEK